MWILFNPLVRSYLHQTCVAALCTGNTSAECIFVDNIHPESKQIWPHPATRSRQPTTHNASAQPTLHSAASRRLVVYASIGLVGPCTTYLPPATTSHSTRLSHPLALLEASSRRFLTLICFIYLQLDPP
ncbi:hypothetical protein GGS21DRAFT_64209 [Xylaria nigripes]|nr:hypothetical protein GGS21DRAFT_64209 [Xylaria nigripes]